MPLSFCVDWWLKEPHLNNICLPVDYLCTYWVGQLQTLRLQLQPLDDRHGARDPSRAPSRLSTCHPAACNGPGDSSGRDGLAVLSKGAITKAPWYSTWMGTLSGINTVCSIPPIGISPTTRSLHATTPATRWRSTPGTAGAMSGVHPRTATDSEAGVPSPIGESAR
jgi:hypothetical protein